VIAKRSARADRLTAGEFPTVFVFVRDDPVGRAGIFTDIRQAEFLEGVRYHAMMNVKLDMVDGAAGDCKIVKGRQERKISRQARLERVELGRGRNVWNKGADAKNGRFRQPFADAGNGPLFADEGRQTIGRQGKGRRIEITEKGSEDFNRHFGSATSLLSRMFFHAQGRPDREFIFIMMLLE
jgi:hypothetical protein